MVVSPETLLEKLVLFKLSATVFYHLNVTTFLSCIDLGMTCILRYSFCCLAVLRVSRQTHALIANNLGSTKS